MYCFLFSQWLPFWGQKKGLFEPFIGWHTFNRLPLTSFRKVWTGLFNTMTSTVPITHPPALKKNKNNKTYMGVSKNNGWFGGPTPILGNTHMAKSWERNKFGKFFFSPGDFFWCQWDFPQGKGSQLSYQKLQDSICWDVFCRMRRCDTFRDGSSSPIDGMVWRALAFPGWGEGILEFLSLFVGIFSGNFWHFLSWRPKSLDSFSHHHGSVAKIFIRRVWKGNYWSMVVSGSPKRW